MIIERMKLQTEGSLPDAHFIAYVLDTPGDLHIKKRPMVILCPGGGYERTSFREGEPIAMYFLQKGYHVGILRYSTAPAKYPTALLELGMAMGIVKGHSEEWKVDETGPVQKSVRMAEALHEKGIRTELHLFQQGSHGLGSAGEESRRADGSGVQEECQCWMDLAYKWMENICKDQ